MLQNVHNYNLVLILIYGTNMIFSALVTLLDIETVLNCEELQKVHQCV